MTVISSLGVTKSTNTIDVIMAKINEMPRRVRNFSLFAYMAETKQVMTNAMLYSRTQGKAHACSKG